MLTHKKLRENISTYGYKSEILKSLIRRTNSRIVSDDINSRTYWYEAISWKNFDLRYTVVDRQ